MMEGTDEPGGPVPRVALTAQPGGPPASGDQVQRTARDVGRGILALFASRFITMPLTIVVNAVLAHYLGASDFGSLYLATTALTLGVLFVDFGSATQAAAMVARDPSSAPRCLGGGILIRLALGVPLLLAIPPITRLLGYSDQLRLVFLLTGVRTLFAVVNSLAASVVRGLELISQNARMAVILSVVESVLVVPVLYFGGGIVGVLWVNIGTAVVGLVCWFWLLHRVGVARPIFDATIALRLLFGGLGFVAFDIATRLQPWIDSSYLVKLGSADAVGWFAAASRLVGSLLIPATSLSFVIYPTLARLWEHDRESYLRMTRLALRAMILFGTMAAVGSISFADLVVGILYGKKAFGPAARDLQILSVYILLVYASMILGIAIMAAKRQLPWAGVQFVCIPVSLAVDPWLIPRLQARYGNGGLAVCIGQASAELLMVMGALWLVPKGVLDVSLLKSVGRGLGAGAAMGACAWALRALPVLAIPASVLVYFGVHWALGGLDREMIAQLKEVLGNRIGNSQVAPSPPQ